MELAAGGVDGHANSPTDQRGGVFSTAQGILEFLSDADVARWVTRAGAADSRAQLDVDAFVRSTDTVYLLSREGKGSSAGVVTALLMALCDAAEQLAKRSPGGRLQLPLVGVLDEAANVCRWPQLPNLYSHYGSRGVCLLAILQCWSQGVEVWGTAEMEKLWSSSNVKCYGGGVDEDGFLSRLARLVGDYDRATVSVSSGRRDGASTAVDADGDPDGGRPPRVCRGGASWCSCPALRRSGPARCTGGRGRTRPILRSPSGSTIRRPGNELSS